MVGGVLNAEILLGHALLGLKASRQSAEGQDSSRPRAANFETCTPSLILVKLALEVEDHAAVACAMLNVMQSLVEDGGSSWQSSYWRITPPSRARC